MIPPVRNATQSGADVPQASFPGQLRVQHRLQQIPRAETSDIFIGFVLVRELFKMKCRNYLLHLYENHSILVHAINSPLKPLFYFVFGKSIIKQARKINSIFHSFLFILWDSSDIGCNVPGLFRIDT